MAATRMCSSEIECRGERADVFHLSRRQRKRTCQLAPRRLRDRRRGQRLCVRRYRVQQSPTSRCTAGDPRRRNPGQFDEDVFLTRINASGTTFSFSTYHGGSAIDATDDVSRRKAVRHRRLRHCVDRRQHGVRGFSDDGGRLRHHVQSATAPPAAAMPSSRAMTPTRARAATARCSAVRVMSSPRHWRSIPRAMPTWPPAAAPAISRPRPARRIPATTAAGGDVVIAKLNPAGSALVYATFLGGTSGEAPHQPEPGCHGHGVRRGLYTVDHLLRDRRRGRHHAQRGRQRWIHCPSQCRRLDLPVFHVAGAWAATA